MNYNINNYKNGCTHYNINCLIYTDCCKQWLSCNLCHNNNDCKKNLDRKNISRMKCLSCKIIQSISDTCHFCNTKMGIYYCIKCNLFDNDGLKKQIFHCDKCNHCRIGGKENFIHCNLCKICTNKDEYDYHICIIDSKKNNCCICQINMEYSLESLKLLICGHVIHDLCFNMYIKNITKNKKRKRTINYICPICNILLIYKKN